jgi:hypothetical protein
MIKPYWFWVLLLVACGGAPPGPPLPPHADTIQQCNAICDRLDVLRCQGAEGNEGPDDVAGTPDDAPCELACVETMQVVALNADCIVAAGDCADVSDCEVE